MFKAVENISQSVLPLLDGSYRWKVLMSSYRVTVALIVMRFFRLVYPIKILSQSARQHAKRTDTAPLQSLP